MSVCTTEECVDCHYVFLRYMDYRTEEQMMGERKVQRICPVCQRPVIVVKIRHAEEQL